MEINQIYCYSSIDNKLKIKMNNGRNQKPKIYIIDDVPLQKWKI